MSVPTENDLPDRDAIRSLLGAGDEAAVRAGIVDFHPADLADLLDSLEDAEQRLQLFRLLEPETAADVVREVNEHTRADLAERLSDARLTAVLERLDTDDAADLLGHLPEDRLDRLLRRASPEVRRNVAGLLTYPEDSAGGLMKTEVAVATEAETVREVIETIRRRADEFHDVNDVFITDEERRLVGRVPLRSLLLYDDDTPMRKMMDPEVVSVEVDVDQEEVARIFEKYDLLSVPVTDALGRVVGRITVDDIVDVISEEATEDILKLAGVGDESFTSSDPAQAVRSRLPWLSLNLVTAGISALAISLFQTTIEKAAIAAALMTVVSALGGNAGTQTMTVLVRAISLGEVRGTDVSRVLMRETITAIANGVLIGAISSLGFFLMGGRPLIGAVFGISLVLNFLFAAVAGCLLPLGLKGLNIDPAIGSPVFVTAATDWLGFLTFLGLLSLVL